jgi:DNA-binding transcriptional ArsR family regulator
LATNRSEQINLVQAAAHPLRAHALSVMIEEPVSPKQLAERLGEPIGKVSYHVRELRRAGLIELVETRKRRGATQHFYRAPCIPLLDLEDWGKLDDDERRFISALVIHLLLADLGLALQADTIDARVDRHLCRFDLRMDEQGWIELRDLFDETVYGTLEIRQRAAERLRLNAEKGTRGSAAVLSFVVPELD